VFETISQGFRAARERFSGEGELTEDVIDAALKDVRLSLLEADVEFRVVKRFLKAVKTRALGEKVKLTAKDKEGRRVRVSPGDHFVQICYDALVELMGPVDAERHVRDLGLVGARAGRIVVVAQPLLPVEIADQQVVAEAPPGDGPGPGTVGLQRDVDPGAVGLAQRDRLMHDSIVPDE